MPRRLFVVFVASLLLNALDRAPLRAQNCSPFGDPPANVLESAAPQCPEGKVLGPWKDTGNTPRYACLYEPPSASPSNQLPLIVFLHPSLYITDVAIELAKLNRTANLNDDPSRPGFILIAPIGRSITHWYPAPDDKGLGWDNWYRQFATASMTIDGIQYDENADAAAIDHFIGAEVMTGKVDSERIFLSGWSNGAAMAYEYALNRPAVAAIAVYAAPNPFGAFSDRCPQLPVTHAPSDQGQIEISNPRLAAYQIHPDCDIAGLCPNSEKLQRQVQALGASVQDTLVDWKMSPANGCYQQCGTDPNADAKNQLSLTLGVWLHTHWPFTWDPQMLDYFRMHPRRTRLPGSGHGDQNG
jgi:hypothetical protein